MSDLLNEKMKAVADSIEGVIRHVFSADYLDFICADRIKIPDVVIQVLVECSKNAYDVTAEKYSLRHHLVKSNMDDDSNRMVIKRSLDKIYQYRSVQYQFMKQRKSIDMPDLLKKRMITAQQKLDGYRISDFQFWEICNVHDTRLIEAILSRRIGKKNTTVSTFVEYADEFDTVLTNMKSRSVENDDSYVFASLAVLTLEWKYHFNFFYLIANELDVKHKTVIPDYDKIMPFCSTIYNYISPFFRNETITTENRFIRARERCIADIIGSEPPQESAFTIYQYVEAVCLIARLQSCMTYKGLPIRKWFIEHTTMSDWASVFYEYNAFHSLVTPKTWTANKVRLMKAMYEKISFDYKNPDFRS